MSKDVVAFLYANQYRGKRTKWSIKD